MASYGTNTYKGVTFGIVTTGDQGVPDFSQEHIYAKRDAPYSGTTTLQYSGKRSTVAIDLVVMVHDDDWAAFKAAAGSSAGTLVWSSRLGRSNSTCRLLNIANIRQFPESEHWRATARFEG